MSQTTIPNPAPAIPPKQKTRPESSSAAPEPIVELRNLGIWYRRYGGQDKRPVSSFKQLVLNGWRRPFKPRFTKHWALRHIDLTCYEGETLGVIGANGAGKSTLCLALSNILQPDEGTVTIRGKVAALLTLGAGFNRDLTGRANILLNGAFLGIPREQILEKVDEIIDFSELGDFIDEPVRAYSSGMKSRLAFSIASTVEPEILILDEVFSTGDQAFRKKSKKRLKEMIERSRLIVIVSHSMKFVETTCTRCVWLHQGSIARTGKSKAVLKKYQRWMKKADAREQHPAGSGVE